MTGLRRTMWSEGGGGGGAGGAGQHFTDHGGPVVLSGRIQLVFWGSGWASTPTPSAGQIVDAVTKMCAGPYLWGLREYRGIHPAVVAGAQVVTTSTPPNAFSDGDVQNLLTNLFSQQRLPPPASDSQLIYIVVMPPGVGSSGSFIGEHTYFAYGGANAHYAWVTNGGTLDSVTAILSHELVETCTDPEGSAILGDPGTCSQGGWCEIGDVCYAWATVDGVYVQQYWSQQHGGCVLSDDKYVADNKGSKDTKDTKEIKDHKDGKEHKDSKDHKDFKDRKEGKEGPKEIKDGAKEKDLDRPPASEQIASIASQLAVLAAQTQSLGGGVAPTGETPFPTGATAPGGGVVEGAQTFIPAGERPVVGEQVTQRKDRDN